MTRRPALAAPFVVTLVVGATCAVGCAGGSDTPRPSRNDAGDGGLAACPDASSYNVLCAEKVAKCVYTLSCTGGKEQAILDCDGGFDQMISGSCSRPYESCTDGTKCNSGVWQQPLWNNPPPPCPSQLPDEGTLCPSYFFGGYAGPCGYPCDGGWIVFSCDGPSNDAGTPTWKSGACAPL